MTNNLLRIEAVNMRYCVEDTEDLSARRAGGYMLLLAIREIEEKFGSELKPISTGASIGVFEITGNSRSLVQDIDKFLTDDPLYRHATFMIDTIAENDFKGALERAIAANRWQQMQSLSFSAVWGKAAEVCKIDRARPAATEDWKKDGSGMHPVSLSIRDRRTDGGRDKSKSGRKLRQRFYEKELAGCVPEALKEAYRRLDEEEKTPDRKTSFDPFTNDTEKLSGFKGEWQGLPPNLSGKMAVFYADGNKFSRIQKECKGQDALNNWDTEIKKKRKQLLLALLNDHALKSPRWKTDEGRIRMEILMWGGDELMFLVPAWMGLELAQFFFEHTKDWEHGGYKLTHAAGMVFAHHNAPISRLQSLARSLAEQGKKLRDKNSLT